MTKGFIKNQELLEEKISNIDCLDFSDSVETLSEKLSTSEKSIIIGIVGPFGVGKSTLISKVKEIHSQKDEEWIHFDAWQFPERKELWDGLILETAKQVGRLETTKRSLDGEKHKDKKLAVDTAARAVDLVTGIATGGISSLFKNATDLVGGTLKYFLESTPAKRVFEMQEVFIEIIKKIDAGKIVFVLEDIDRSGKDGLFFLETFRQFLSNNNLQKDIVVITPISNGSYFAYLDTYLKCLDFVEFFNKKTDSKLTKFISEVFETKDSLDTNILIDFFNYAFSKYEDLNMRKIKLILRQANLDYIELERKGFQPDPLICIAVAASRYLKANASDKDTYFNHYIKLGTITSGSAISRMIFISNKKNLFPGSILITNHENEVQNSFDIKLIKRDRPDNITGFPSIPYRDRNPFSDDENKVCLPDFYFKDL